MRGMTPNDTTASRTAWVGACVGAQHRNKVSMPAITVDFHMTSTPKP